MLKLNDDKTEALLVGPKKTLKKMQVTSVEIGSSTITFSSCVKNLGVLMDSNLTMEAQINHLCKSCYYHLQCIGQIRHLITLEAAKILVQSLVTSRLDYSNSLLSGLTKEQLKRLQRVQNTAARLVTRSSRPS